MSDSNFLYLRRRQLIRGFLAATAFATTTKFGTGCSAGKQTQATSAGAVKSVVMGFI